MMSHKFWLFDTPPPCSYALCILNEHHKITDPLLTLFACRHLWMFPIFQDFHFNELNANQSTSRIPKSSRVDLRKSKVFGQWSSRPQNHQDVSGLLVKAQISLATKQSKETEFENFVVIWFPFHMSVVN